MIRQSARNLLKSKGRAHLPIESMKRCSKWAMWLRNQDCNAQIYSRSAWSKAALPPRGACMRRLHAASSPQLMSFAQSDDTKACAIPLLAFVPVRVSSSAASGRFVGGNPCWCPHKSTCSKADIQQCCCRQQSYTSDCCLFAVRLECPSANVEFCIDCLSAPAVAGSCKSRNLWSVVSVKQQPWASLTSKPPACALRASDLHTGLSLQEHGVHQQAIQRLAPCPSAGSRRSSWRSVLN